MRRALRSLLAGCLLATVFLAAVPFGAAIAAEDAPDEIVVPAPAWEPELLRLAEVMGALAFLRDLCEAPDAPEWPARMQRLIEAEGGARGERLAGAYNRGFRAFALTYRICTPAAERAIAGYLDEGERLTRAVARRFGG